MRSILIFICIFLFFLSVPFFIYQINDYEERQIRKRRAIGEYILDIHKTNLGVYKNDSSITTLKLVIYENGRFFFSHSVPFIFDTTGNWVVGGIQLSETNKMYFEKDPQMISQFSRCCSPDSTFSISGVIPKKGNPFIEKIFFKKLNPSSNDLKYFN